MANEQIDNTADASQVPLSADELEALQNGWDEESDADLSGAEETGTETPAESGVATVEIDGESFTVDQLREFKANGLRASDYTRKTQELAEQRKRTEQFETLMDAWENKPEARGLILQALAEEAGMSLGNQPAPRQTQAPANPQTGLLGRYDPTDGRDEWEQRGYASSNELMLHQQNINLASALGKMENYISSQIADREADTTSARAVAEIEGQLGLTGVQASAVREAMKVTGISDPVGAYLKVHAKDIIALAKGVAPASKPVAKPSSPPAGGARTFNVNDFVDDPDLIARLMAKGMVPVDA